ncbi:hypothetical protein V8G54_016887 [Vigna mungo]|uniref:Uncharacterized protein n=1 Tax=Vigna mungo TaxID=3915 RepID=A0AAQ3NNE2_VIGMU
MYVPRDGGRCRKNQPSKWARNAAAQRSNTCISKVIVGSIKRKLLHAAVTLPLQTVLSSIHRQASISPQGSTTLTVFQGCQSVTVNQNSYAFPFRRLERTYPETAIEELRNGVEKYEGKTMSNYTCEKLQEVREKYVCDWILDVDNVWRDEVLQDLRLL